MFNIYYAKKGTEFYFLNKLEDDIWVNVLEIDKDVAINGNSEANVILLYKTYSLIWGSELIASNIGVFVFTTLMHNNMFAVKADNITKKQIDDKSIQNKKRTSPE
jgi:hypothetical protein|tara:strand:+ start:122 stop:436 length:315 start_codon:yes stop_codon:yes gene_type:complete